MTTKSIILGIILFGSNANADMLQDYNMERVEYIQTEYKLLPEATPFKCFNKVLYKSGFVQRKHTGRAQTCKIITMTRDEYENTIITNLF